MVLLPQLAIQYLALDRHMVTNSAICIDTTETKTRILALSIYASLVCWTVSIYLALWSAIERTSNHF